MRPFFEKVSLEIGTDPKTTRLENRPAFEIRSAIQDVNREI